MKWAALVTALSNLFLKIAEIIGRHEANRQREAYEQDIDSILSDPIAHANRLYADNGDPETMSRDYPQDSADQGNG